MVNPPVTTFGGGYRPGIQHIQDPLAGAFVDFLASQDYTVKRGGVTIDYTTVSADANGDRILKAGTLLGKITATGKYGPYRGTTEEVQTVSITGAPTGGTFTLTWNGQTTAAIPYNATAAQVQTALIALSNIGPGDVVCSGGPLPGTAVTVTFGGALANVDQPAMTHTDSLTGGTSPAVAIATTTAGGGAGAADGLDVAKGALFAGDMNFRWGDMTAGMLIRGSVLEARIWNVDPAAKADLGDRFIWQ
jgi:hypothetical protein